MKRTLIPVVLAALAIPSLAAAEANVSINIGIPAVSVQAPPRVVFESPPLFLAPPRLGFYVGVDMPYDMVFISGTYYLFQGNGWYRARHHNGPWVAVRHDRLPREVRNYRIEKIRDYREREYRSYQHEREQYRGRHYRPDREEKRYQKQERRYEKEQQREDRRQEREDRPDKGKHHGHDD